jgi:hypothetical protein
MLIRHNNSNENLTASQCEELVDARDAAGKSIIDRFESFNDNLDVLIRVFGKLSPEKIYSIAKHP